MSSIAEAATGALLLLAAWFGGFIGAYSKKKGENLATHEDLQNLVEQMKAVTAATKTIEATISDKSWDRQKQWELKRDALFPILEALTDADDAMVDLAGAAKGLAIAAEKRATDELSWRAGKALLEECLDEWTIAINRFDAKRRVASLVCSMETINLFFEVGQRMREAKPQIIKGEISSYSEFGPSFYEGKIWDIMPSLQKTILRATIAAKELGLPPLNDAERMEA